MLTSMPVNRRFAQRSSGRFPAHRSPPWPAFALGAVLLVAAVLGVHFGSAAGGSPHHSAATPATRPSARRSTSAAPAPTARRTSAATDPLKVYALKTPYPASGPDTFRYATGTGAVLGHAGPVRRFSVAIESNVDVVSMADVTAKIDATLGDPRSWIAGGQYRLQRVPHTTAHEFTIYLSTPKTTDRLCAPLHSNGYTSCRQGSKVVLNLARWMTSVPYYTQAKVVLDTYRTYMVNHEVGHALGHEHELCPGSGDLAPVMEQQTFGLHGCKPNPWPYVHGRRYDGPPGRY
jgi:hypothetical protein